ncbi:hypothetical protein SCHPADRAFT_939791 [Schizopora paradoxa]|uniref:Protein kinase domain-containing protein n=1 Tax=Schizopora paradoxa TaxID=27342 RepID=A0A0H2RQH5_9AGAM|nr:hypothetical protein SCHPADRAFT_939791 [Schizopora paradoxa]
MATRPTPAGPISESITPMPAISIGNDDDDWEIEYRLELQERQKERLTELTKHAEEDFNKRKANALDDRATLERVHESYTRSLARIKQMMRDEEIALLDREREIRKRSRGEVDDEASEQLKREQHELWDNGDDDDNTSEIEYRAELQEMQKERLPELTKQAEEDFNKRKANALDDRATLERVLEYYMRSFVRINQVPKDEEDAMLERGKEIRTLSRGEVDDEASEQLKREQQELWDQLRGRRYSNDTASEQKTRRPEQHSSSSETRRATAQQRQPSQAPAPQLRPTSRPTMWVPPETPKEINRIPVPRQTQRWVSGSSTAPSFVQPSRNDTRPPMQYGPSNSSSVTSLPLLGNPSLGQNAPPPSSDVSVFDLPERGFSSSAHKISNNQYVKKSALPPMPSKQVAFHRVEDSLQTSPQTHPGRQDRAQIPPQSRISPKPRGENSSRPPTDKRHPSSSLSGTYFPPSTQPLSRAGPRGPDTSSSSISPDQGKLASSWNHRPSVGNAKTASTMGSSHRSSIKQGVSSLLRQSKGTTLGFEQTLEDQIEWRPEREAPRTNWSHKREEARKQLDEIRKKGYSSSASSAAMSILRERDSQASGRPKSKRGFGLSTTTASKPSVDYEESGEQLESRDESLHGADGTPRTDNLNASGHFEASPRTGVSLMQRQKGGLDASMDDEKIRKDDVRMGKRQEEILHATKDAQGPPNPVSREVQFGSNDGHLSNPSGANYEERLRQLLDGLNSIDLTGHISEQAEHFDAHGCSSDVYKAKLMMHDHMLVDVAVKRIRIHIYRNKSVAKIIFRELKVWSGLNHPNILPLLGYVRHGEYPAMVSRWMVKGSTRDYIERNPDYSKAYMTTGIAAGLAYLHERNIVHSDLKSDNIFISDSGEPLLADFGISRIVTQTSSTSQSSAKGSIRWMAIEFWLSDLNEEEGKVVHTKHTDIWAFGMVELLTHRVPFFEITSDVRVLSKIEKGLLPSRPTSLEGGDKQLLWSICQECWRTIPQERPNILSICERLSNDKVRERDETDSGIENEGTKNVMIAEPA